MNRSIRSRRWALHLLTLLVIGVFAVLGAGTTGSDDDSSDSDEPASPGAAARRALEGHFSRGQAYGEGPGGAQMAASMREMLDPDMGDTLVVQVIPGNPERIVALLKLRDLRDFSDTDRQEWLDSFGNTIRDGYGASDSHIVVGIRGNVFYGAVAVMTPTATTWNTETGTMVSTNAIDEALAATAAPSAPTDPRQDIYGEIAASDQPYPREYEPTQADRIPLTLAAGQTVTIRMNSPILDSYLLLLGPDGSVLAENDDSGGLNSMITHTATVAGQHTIVATIYSPGDLGPYVVRTRVAGAGAAPTAPPAPPAPPAQPPQG